MEEAGFRETEHGLVPEGDGWFIVNAREIAWETIPGSGTWCVFESPDERAARSESASTSCSRARRAACTTPRTRRRGSSFSRASAS